jgi:methylated-DNA-[protein]-cysteine S-methyltransferase
MTEALTLAFGTVPTDLGMVLVAVTELGVAATSLRDSPEARQWIDDRFEFPVVDDPARTEPARRELAAYFAGDLRTFTVALDLCSMSAARRAVLTTLHTTVPYGQVITYGELAARSGTTVPPRGIGAMMASNPIPVIVPCHRVVAGTHLGGFSAGDGLESKRRLLTLEGHLPPTLW